jgi:hypothetical protein
VGEPPSSAANRRSDLPPTAQALHTGQLPIGIRRFGPLNNHCAYSPLDHPAQAVVHQHIRARNLEGQLDSRRPAGWYEGGLWMDLQH